MKSEQEPRHLPGARGMVPEFYSVVRTSPSQVLQSDVRENLWTHTPALHPRDNRAGQEEVVEFMFGLAPVGLGF
jgi:hypothetical protein